MVVQALRLNSSTRIAVQLTLSLDIWLVLKKNNIIVVYRKAGKRKIEG
jgi:hypothetical protein